MIGGGAKRDSATGLYLYKIRKDANGNPTRGTNILDPEKHWGSIVPKVNGGLINSLTYKDFVFNFSVDYQVGGKYFSLMKTGVNIPDCLLQPLLQMTEVKM